jgi:hypothetical protein
MLRKQPYHFVCSGMNEDKKNELRNKIMAVINKRGVAMRPRWHFLLLSALATAGVLILVIALLYIASLALFFVREGGGWYAPAFGGRGWAVLLRSAPVLLLILIALFAVLLEILVRRYSFAYRAPLLISLGGILGLVFIGGFALAQTSLHRRLESEARHGHLPPPMGMWYGKPFRGPRPGDMYRGVITVRNVDNFMILDTDGAGTSTVKLTRKTRLPYGEDFGLGDMVIVIGDMEGTSTIRAYGVRKVDGDQ